MGYRPENEYIEGSISEIIEGIRKFKDVAFHRRNGSSGWGVEHLTKLTEAENMLNDVELALRVLTR